MKSLIDKIKCVLLGHPSDVTRYSAYMMETWDDGLVHQGLQIKYVKCYRCGSYFWRCRPV